MTKVQTQCRKKLQSVYRRRKIRNPNRHIDRLFKSVYPCQYNDYVMLRYPKGNDAPVDAPLYPTVRKLLKSGYRVAGWDCDLYRKNGGFMMVGVDTANKKLNTQRKLAYSLAELFDNDCLLHKKEPKKFNEDLIELCYFSSDSVSINFSKRVLKDVKMYLNVQPSKKQVLPGFKSAKIPEKLSSKLWKELVKEDIEVEDMF